MLELQHPEMYCCGNPLEENQEDYANIENRHKISKKYQDSKENRQP